MNMPNERVFFVYVLLLRSGVPVAQNVKRFLEWVEDVDPYVSPVMFAQTCNYGA